MGETRLIRDHMTLMPRTVAHRETLGEASRRMKELRSHHLPVVNDGELVGMISDRDVALAEALGIELDKNPVLMAMTIGPFVCGPDTPVSEVAARMLENRCGSTVVVDGTDARKIIGIFTVTDALRLVAEG